MTVGQRSGRVGFLLWLALLCFGLPELLAGSSPMWPLDPAIWILTIPLYFLHFVLLVQVALATGRTSWPALYLLGVVFGLYESWITKVVWSGYPGSHGFALGGIGTFGLHETVGLVLGYHPLFSFLLPLAVMCRLFPAWGAAFPAPDWVFGSGRWAMVARWSLVAAAVTFNATNFGDPAVFLTSWLPFLALIVPGYLILAASARRGGDTGAALTSPRLGRAGTVFAALGLAAIYAFSYRGILPERLPPLWAQAVTVLAYPVLALLVRATPPVARPGAAGQPAATPGAERLPLALLLAIVAAGLFMAVTDANETRLGQIMTIVAFVALVPLGGWFFVRLGLWPRLRRAPPPVTP